MDNFNVLKMLDERDQATHTYDDFFTSAKLSLGLSVWPAGSVDEQRPHGEDEVYYVVRGRGQIMVGNEDRPVEAGSVVFVAAGVDHRFHNIAETLEVLVFWAPPHKT